MTEDERHLQAWHNEKRNHCQFPTQRSYDERTAALKKLKQQFLDKEISEAQVAVTLEAVHGYGNQAAKTVARRWQDEMDADRQH